MIVMGVEINYDMDELKDYVVEWMNDTFAEVGLEPINELPKGTPADCSDCVIGRIVNDGLPDVYKVDGNGIKNEDKGINYPINKEITAFIDLFDNRSYPELVDK